MLRRTLNLGILAHVDAGKTTLTERLLYAAGVIDEIGSVDDGTTQTDTLALERQRGITIKSAVVAFSIGDVNVNLIDTPGHPDFIAEVERVLGVLDGAVLVISAVEGVQPQTRLLMRALQRLRVPTLIFVNKIDRAGADDDGTLEAIEKRLTPAVVPMGAATGLGTRGAAFVPFGPLDPELIRQAQAGEIHPVFFGSALTGAGMQEAMDGIAELLPAEAGDEGGPVSGRVFKIDRGPAGERIAYVRMFSGTVHVRDRLEAGKVTALRVFDDGDAVQRSEARAGEIAKVSGLDVRIGDWVGTPGAGPERQFAPPPFEAVVVPANPTEANRLRVALAQLAEQDPLIDARLDDEGREISVSLYGEVQKEVVQATLAADFGLDVGFMETTPICVERPSAAGDAVETMNTPSNPFHTDLGLRVEPAPAGSGVAVRLDVEARNAPLYVFKGFESFAAHMEEYVGLALARGLFGWQVVDCIVTVTQIAYSLADGPPARRGPMPTANDVKKVTALVLARALADGGTTVCEPISRVKLELPAATIGTVLAALGRLGGVAQPPSLEGENAVVETVLAATAVQELQRQLPGLTGGEGVLESEPAGYRPVTGAPPARRGTSG